MWRCVIWTLYDFDNCNFLWSSQWKWGGISEPLEWIKERDRSSHKQGWEKKNQGEILSSMYLQGEKHLRKLSIMSLQQWNTKDVVLALQPSEVRKHVTQAMKAQEIWVRISFKQRWQFPWILVKYIIEHQELVCEISSLDTGKTMVGASLEEIMAIHEKIT